MLNLDQRSRILSGIAEEAVPDSMDIWPAVRQRAQRAHRRSIPQGGLRARLGLLAAAAVLVALIGVAVVPFWSPADAVSAETILDRAETAASSGAATVSTYHLLMTRTSKEGGTTLSEVWFGGADRQRTIQQTVAPTGATLSRQDVVFNGADTWIEQTENGATRVIHTVGTTWTRPADTPSDQPDIAAVLRTFGDKTCMAARLEQTRATVAGQETYVITARPAVLGCGTSQAAAVVQASPGPAESQPRIRVNGQPAGSVVEGPNELTVWVDKRSFLPLKMEIRDSHGVVVDQSEVTRVEYNVAISDKTFAYAPPAGVPVATFSGGDGADVKRAMASDLQTKAAPGKSP
jgi:outer membrane lipoprotein-sorting protein